MLVQPLRNTFPRLEKKCVKEMISKVALTQLIMKRYLHTPISFHAIRHIRLWHPLSTRFDLLLEPSQSPMTSTQLRAFLLQSSPSMLFWVNLVL